MIEQLEPDHRAAAHRRHEARHPLEAEVDEHGLA
jgi:hypothetical protein